MEIRSLAGTALSLAAAVCCMSLCSCEGFIREGEGDCSVHYRVGFSYDYNMKYADAFAHEVSGVTLYVVDAGGNVVWQKTEEGDMLAAKGYEMEVDVPPGRYSLLAWCGASEGGMFTVGRSSRVEGLTCSLNHRRDADGRAYVDTDPGRLFHGYLSEREFPTEAGTYHYTVPLVKDTNVFYVTLQCLSGETVDKDRFSFTITADNGQMEWDNSLTYGQEEVDYRAWRTAMAEGRENVATDPGEQAGPNAVMAELTTARLVAGGKPRLTVTDNSEGRPLFTIPVTDYALMVKDFYNRDMSDQEYLDRQDEYNLVFFLDRNDRWDETYIYINSWKVVLQNRDL